MKNAATDIVHFRGARLPFKQVKFNDPVCCVYGPDCSECEGIGLIAGDDVNAVEGDLRDNKFFTEDGLINLHYCFARLLLNCDSTARTADHAGDEITEGSVNPHDILKIKGLRGVQDYMIQEVQRVYRLQGVEISDKHIEVIVRQMLKKIRIEEKGDTEFLPGTMVDVLDFEEVNEQLVAEGKEPATGEQIMLGITKASLATESFLSAASFQETTKVLTEAAIKGKVDHLVGLKENVIIGKHIPAGTGMKKYRDVKLNTDIKMEDELDLEDDLNLDEDFDMDENVDLTDEFVEENTEDAAETSVEEPATEE